MRILIAYNPISGRGVSEDAAVRMAAELEQAGHDASVVATTPGPGAPWLSEHAEGTSLLMACGGDGTLCAVAPEAARHGIALWHLPLGTENLFAQAWSMSGDPAAVVAAVEAWQIKRLDLGVVDGPGMRRRNFLLMLSAGIDAHVVLDLAASRRGRITRWSYARPLLRQLWRYHPDVLTIEVDGTPVVQERSGGAVIANCHRFGAHLDPAPEAVMDDGLLDVTFYGAPSRWSVLAWMCRFRRGTASSSPDLVQMRGKRITVRSQSPTIWQLDGDPASSSGTGLSEVVVTLDAGVVPILLPGIG